MGAISGSQLVQYALQFLGTPYVWGGDQPGGFDCSGLMQYVYSHFGLSIPRVTYDQIHAGRVVSNVSSAQPGDLVFFDSDHNGTPSHVGMYMGNNQIVVADSTGTPVRVRSLAQEDRIIAITRMNGVVSTNNDFGSFGDYSSLLGLTGLNGHSGYAAMPSARPTFDWFSGLGVSSGNTTDASQNVGLIKAFIGNDPELQDLYSKAVAGSWSQDAFVSALQATNWWKNNSDTVRQNLAMRTTDPATYNKQVAAEQANIQQLASQMGVPLSGNSLQNVAATATMFGYNEAQVRSMLGSYLTDMKAGWMGGYAGQVQLALKEYAADQGIPVSDQYVNRNTQAIVAGTATLNDVRAVIATQAAAAFPAYADQINKGVTVGQIAQPYANAVSQILEQDPNTVDLFSPVLRNAMTFTQPQKPGDSKSPRLPAVKQLYDYERDLRQNPRWMDTNNAREGMMSSAHKVLSDMGLTATDVGAAPQTSPNAPTDVSSSVSSQSTGLSGMTSFSTLQGKEALANPSFPTDTAAAAAAPSTSGTTQGTKQGGL